MTGTLRVRLLDFGLAVASGTSRAPVAGTPGYMAPEVLAGGRLSPRADQYAFCVSASDALHRFALSRRLQRTLRRGTSVRASRRFASMDPIVGALERELTMSRRRVGLGVLGAGMLVALAVPSFGKDQAAAPASSVEPRRLRAEQLDAALTEAKTAIAMGRGDAASLEAEAREALGADDWTASVAYWVLGELAHARADYAQARTHYEDAAFLALRAGNDRVVVRASCAMVELGDVWGLGPSASEAWMRQARSALARSPSDELEVHVSIAAGWRALSSGKHEEARASFDRALDLATRWAGENAPMVSTLHYDLGCALVARRAFEAADLHFDAALRGWTRAFGEDASVLALAWKGRGDVARGQGRFDAAVDAYERGRAVIDERTGSLKAASLEVSLADALYRLGRDEQALAAYERARGLLLPLNDQHRFLVVVEIGMGNLERDRKQWGDAFDHYRRARDLSHEIEGGASLNAAIASSSAAEAAMNLERYDEALQLLEASIETRVAMFGEDDLSLAFPLTTMGELRRRSGRPKEGLPPLHRALELRLKAPDVDSRLRAETHLALARTHEDLGDRPAAIEHAKAARAGFDGPWAHAAEDVAMVDAVLTRLRTAG
jgi:tetratricopeptide (TPR) repeat protein